MSKLVAQYSQVQPTQAPRDDLISVRKSPDPGHCIVVDCGVAVSSPTPHTPVPIPAPTTSADTLRSPSHPAPAPPKYLSGNDPKTVSRHCPICLSKSPSRFVSCATHLDISTRRPRAIHHVDFEDTTTRCHHATPLTTSFEGRACRKNSCMISSDLFMHGALCPTKSSVTLVV